MALQNGENQPVRKAKPGRSYTAVRSIPLHSHLSIDLLIHSRKHSLDSYVSSHVDCSSVWQEVHERDELSDPTRVYRGSVVVDGEAVMKVEHVCHSQSLHCATLRFGV